MPLIGPEPAGPDQENNQKGFARLRILSHADAPQRDPAKPFFLMCHHKAPHRSWEFDPKHQDLYQNDIALPETFDDDYKNRAKAAAAAKSGGADSNAASPAII